MIFKKYFRQYYGEKNGDFWQKEQPFMQKKMIVTFIFKKSSLSNANFFAENWRKSPEIVIITLTPRSLESFCEKTTLNRKYLGFFS
jgi:hypothetical protein